MCDSLTVQSSIGESTSIIFIAITFFVIFLIALSYTLAFKVKKTISVLSFLVYFWTSTFIYFVLFVQLLLTTVSHDIQFIKSSLPIVFFIISIVRISTALFVLYTTWRIESPLKK